MDTPLVDKAISEIMGEIPPERQVVWKAIRPPTRPAKKKKPL